MSTVVLYIAGTGRSGSTVLANILGEVDGVFAAGEVRYLWQRGLKEGRLCGWRAARSRVSGLEPGPAAAAGRARRSEQEGRRDRLDAAAAPGGSATSPGFLRAPLCRASIPPRSHRARPGAEPRSAISTQRSPMSPAAA